MMVRSTDINSFIKHLGNAILNSYGMLFFSKNRIFAFLILLVSFITPFAAACGLVAVAISLIAAELLGFNRTQTADGLLTYSVLLFGLGFASNFEFGIAFSILLVVGSLLTLFLSTVLNAILNKRGLPALSLAFIISTALIILASKSFDGIGLTHRQIYWYNETYAIGGTNLVDFISWIENWNMPAFFSGFFRSMSAILFQVNIASGIILTIGLFVYSRIAFLLMVYGYAVALLFSYTMGSEGFLGFYNMGTNFMLVAVALGGFFIIPSVRSFLWVLVLVPIAYLMVSGMGNLMLKVGVPLFSLPFCLTVILFLYMLGLRKTPLKLALTPIQYYSPEENLYRYVNGKERLLNLYYHQLQLPFLGEWVVSQGYDGTMTHQGDWSKALDFVILDHQLKTFELPGNLPEHFYCYNKPVLCPADGIVEEIIDHVEDNEIGGNNTLQNWGNSIVIKHAEGLYTKLSHLKKHSFKTSKGAYVKKGEIIAHCGNSGRSPEPHLHFQVQSTPYVGSKTMPYPISYFVSRDEQTVAFSNFTVPKEGSFISNIETNTHLVKAFNFQPGFIMQVNAPGYETEEWEVFTTYYNETYFHCKTQNTYAYFVNNGTVFYFTNYFGKRDTLLHQFYQSAYKVLLSSERPLTIKDYFPVNSFVSTPIKWMQDLLSPFYLFIRLRYQSVVEVNTNQIGAGRQVVHSHQMQELLWKTTQKTEASIIIENGRISEFSFISKYRKTNVICSI
jgi:urea transporter